MSRSRRLNGNRLAARISRVCRLSLSEWVWLVQALAWFPAVESGLRLLPLRRVLALTQWGARSGSRPTTIKPERVSRLVEAASRIYPFHPTCLKKALVLCALLGRRGLNLQLLLGTAKDEGVFSAHAWVEHEGKILSGGFEDNAYSTLCRLDSRWMLRGLETDVTT